MAMVIFLQIQRVVKIAHCYMYSMYYQNDVIKSFNVLAVINFELSYK